MEKNTKVTGRKEVIGNVWITDGVLYACILRFFDFACIMFICDRVSLWSPGWSGTHTVAQGGPELKTFSV